MSGKAVQAGNPPAGTVTFLFSDIEGSTRLLQRLGEQYADVLMEHHQILRRAFTDQGGREIDVAGDGFFVAFERARDAVAAAVAGQRGLAQHPWPEGEAVRVRMGLHTGEPTMSAGDYIGLDVHRAARIGAVGHGGQILLSQATCELVQHTLPEGLGLRDLGRHRLKDLQHPEHLFQLIVPDLPSDFPPLRTQTGVPNNLPAQPNELIGRDEAVEAVRQLLLRGPLRAVTLTGPGGTGKTRLGLQVAAGLTDEFPDGVYFVPLAVISDPRLLPSSIAAALGVREIPARPVLESLQEDIRGKRLLLLLDNFEQIVAAAPVVAALLAASPGLRVLDTSRVVLHLSGEHEYQVPPLPLPEPRGFPDTGSLERSPAVALFVQRARAVRSEFMLTSGNAEAVARICARLDGLPLAIELAAARIKLLSPQALLDRLGGRLDLLRGGARDLPARHQTLRQAIAWSYDLLAEEEKAFFTRISVFTGGCTLEAVERVCDADGGPGMDPLDAVAALVDKSLLRRGEDPAGEPRFVMLEIIREYGLECLKAAGDWDAARRAHVSYFLRLAEQAEPELTGPRQPQWLDRLEREHDNLRAALTWAEELGECGIGLRLGAALWRFWIVRGHMREGHERLVRLLAMPGAGARIMARARALHGVGTIIHEISDYAEARPFLEESLSIWRELGNKEGTATALHSLGWLAFQVGDFERARSLSEEALLLNRELGEKRGAAVALFDLGIVALHKSEYPLALSLLEESMALRRAVGDRRGCAYVQVTLSWIEQERGSHERAVRILEEALAVLRDLDDRQLFAWALAFRGWVAHDLESLDRARVILEESLSLARVVGNKVIIAWALTHLADVLHSQGEVPLALPLIEEGISLWRAIAKWGLPLALHRRGRMACTMGEFDRASALYQESLEIWLKLGTRRGVAECLEGLAGLALAQGIPEQAAQLYAAAET
ncbi:MAG TPA: tetratricopeptide repeat protein, partial [Candidatus Acidoferrum sp.]|nr:tetratricopeptide repeat protein [Candidatus Acidoferrum sp.]